MIYCLVRLSFSAVYADTFGEMGAGIDVKVLLGAKKVGFDDPVFEQLEFQAMNLEDL